VELRALAEQIVFGADLDADKLIDLGGATDAQAGPALLRPPPLPARAGPYAFSPREAPWMSRPTPAALRPDPARGQLLHAFANHELLALELMALALLRFPEAPMPFRRGLVAVMREEQRHLRLYLARMAELGVAAGEVPVNAFFWRCVADAPTPLDFIVRMSLTLEQANLDFALAYAAVFREVGDSVTADILDQVHADEVGHVRHGLHWMRAWKPPEQSDWEAFESRLKLPLSPSRARGPLLDRAVRQHIGFDEDFIEQLSLYGRTKGRPPALWLFQPSVEREIAHGAGPYSPRAAAAQLAADLAALPAWLGREGDVVLVPAAPSLPWLKQAIEAGMPRAELLPPGAREELHQRKIGSLRPWGWSPSTAAALAEFAPLTLHGRTAWDDALRPLSDKAWAQAQRAPLLAALADPALAPPAVAGHRLDDLADLDALIARVRDENGQDTVVIKAPFGCSGEGQLRVMGPLTDKQRATARNALAQQGHLLVEPWLDRLLDLSFHGDIEPDGTLTFRGVARFEADARGQFRAAHVGRMQAGLTPALLRFLSDEGRKPRRLDQWARATLQHLRPAIVARGHQGPVGVDAFLYRTLDGALRLHPLVELNPRWTMGRLALALEPLIAPGSTGRWEIVAAGSVDPNPPPPLRHQGRLRQGVVFTTEPRPQARFWSRLVISPPSAGAEASPPPDPPT
jgi:uncharacterized ferritin-like protein (DUF455 family)